MRVLRLRNDESAGQRTLIVAFAVVLSLLASVAVGVLAGSGSFLPAAVMAVGGFAVVAAFSPSWVLWGIFILGFVIAGFTRLYIPEVQQVRWLLLPAATVLALHALIVAARSGGIRLPAFGWFAIGFVVVMLASTVVNKSMNSTALLGLKGYFQMWGVIVALALVPYTLSTMRWLGWALLGVAVVQLPFVLHQFFVLVPARVGLHDWIIPVDVVAGTFGAEKGGGGENSMLTAFLIILISGFAALWRRGVISAPIFFTGVVLFFWPIVLTESKISVFYMLTALFIISWRDMFERPKRFALTMAIGAVAMTVLIMGLTALAPKENKVRSLGELIAFTWSYNFGTDRSFSGELSRAGAYRYWFDQHSGKDISAALLGHGAGIARYEDPVARTNSENFGLQAGLGIGRTGATAVLWEAGIIGFLFVIAMFASAISLAGRLARSATDPVHGAFLLSSQVAAAVLLVSFFDKGYFAFQVGYQSMLVFALGYIAWSAREAAERRPLAGAGTRDSAADPAAAGLR